MSLKQRDKLPELKLPLKPIYKKLTRQIGFFELFLKIEREHSNCFLFESLDKNDYSSRYDVLGFGPELLIRASKDALYCERIGGETSKIATSNPYQLLADWLPQNIVSRSYAGGLVGYLGYDASNFFEPVLNLKGHDNFPPFIFALYTDGLIYDKTTAETFYFSYRESRFDFIEECLQGLQTEKLELPKFQAISHGFSCTEKEHREMVLEVSDEIALGNTFQCQIGFQENYEITDRPLAFYAKLREINPSPHMYYVKFDERVLIGSSPELLFRLEAKEIETFPLAGTIGRGTDLNSDLDLARQLLNDPKEIAEHNMLVDLHRNDLGRVARFASLRVRRLMRTKKFSHVQHISSEVAAIIRKDCDMFSGLGAVFPAGTLSGAPKIESMKIIERIEKSPRGPYGGAVGFFGFNGDCTFAIPIRTFFACGTEAFVRASGGVVYDSTPEGEYLEIQNKLRALRLTMESFLAK